MGRYIIRRLLLIVPALLMLSVVTFALLELAPGDPAVKAAARHGTLPRPEDVAYYRALFHLDDPMYLRYLHWLGGLLVGDLGISWDTRQPITSILRETLPRTLLLVSLGLLLAWTLALLLGTLQGTRPNSRTARCIDGVIALLVGTPAFVVALLALYLFCVRWRIFPTGGMVDPGAESSFRQVAHHVALPSIVLGLSYFGWYTRVIAAGIAETRRQLFVTTARAKGLSEGSITRGHLLRPALGPFVTQIGLSLGALVGGSYAVEVVFSWPGIGRMALRSAMLEDYPVVMALVLVTGVLVIIGNLLADVGLALLDPRVRLGSARER